jgi:hypothetical protein
MGRRSRNMSGRSSAALLKRVEELATRDNDGTVELAEALSDLRALPKPPDGDRPTLTELVGRTKRSKRAVCYLLKVWRTFSDLGIPRERLASIGWTKLAVIAENCDPGHEENALTLAQASTLKEFPALLKGGAPKQKARTILLRAQEADAKPYEPTPAEAETLKDYRAARAKKGPRLQATSTSITRIQRSAQSYC